MKWIEYKAKIESYLFVLRMFSYNVKVTNLYKINRSNQNLVVYFPNEKVKLIKGWDLGTMLYNMIRTKHEELTKKIPRKLLE